MSCRHCSVESHPGVESLPTVEGLKKLLKDLAGAGVTKIQLTGGEPLLHQDLFLEVLRYAHELKMSTIVISNGFWGKKRERASEILRLMKLWGLVRLAISYDRFHAEFMGPQPVLNIAECARELGMPVNINVTRTRDDHDLTEILRPFRDLPNVHLRIYDVQPVGKARDLGDDALRANISGFCSGCEQVTVTDDGRVLACNGPSYFEPKHSPLHIGELSSSSVSELLQRHATDPILETIRLSGPVELRKILLETGYEGAKFDGNYSGICQLCHEITRSPEAVAHLRKHLEQPEHMAYLKAKARLKTAGRGVAWNRDAVNTYGSARAFFLLLTAPLEEVSQEVVHTLGRADFDWYQQALLLRRNRLEKQVLRHQEFLKAYAPAFFLELLREERRENGEKRVGRAWDLPSIRECWQDENFANTIEVAVLVNGLFKREGYPSTFSQSLLGTTLDSIGLIPVGYERPASVDRQAGESRAGALRRGLLRHLALAEPQQRLNLFYIPIGHLLMSDSPLSFLKNGFRAFRAIVGSVRQGSWSELRRDLHHIIGLLRQGRNENEISSSKN